MLSEETIKIILKSEQHKYCSYFYGKGQSHYLMNIAKSTVIKALPEVAGCLGRELLPRPC